MKRIYKKYIEKQVKEDKDSILAKQLIYDDIIFNASFKIAFIILFLIYSLLNQDKLGKIARLTADTILNHEVIINAYLYYYIWIIVLLAILVLGLLVWLFGHNKSKYVNLKRAYKYYKIYDLTTFIASIFVIINFIIMYFITPVTVDGRSMENSLYSGDKLLLWHFAYEPEKDDIVVLDASDYHYIEDGGSIFFIKRVVATAGDKLVYNNHYVYCNGIPIRGYYLSDSEWNHIVISLAIDYTTTLIVPEDKYLVFGDNVSNSIDSRSFGFVDEEDIIGKAILRYWPFRDFGQIDKQVKQ